MKLNLLMSAALAPLILAPMTVAAHAETAAATVAASSVVAGDVIFGRVTNASGAPLPGAEVLVRGSGQRVVADGHGEFSLPGLDRRPPAGPAACPAISIPPSTTAPRRRRSSST